MTNEEKYLQHLQQCDNILNKSDNSRNQKHNKEIWKNVKLRNIQKKFILK